jgi:hypothetical protein
MIPHTKAFSRFREQGNDLLDYAVLLSYALPALEQSIAKQSGPTAGFLPKQYFFKNSNLSFEELAHRLKKSDEAFGKEVLISLFSYFDAYFVDLLEELIAFHGGSSAVVERSKRHTRDAIATAVVKADSSRKKLLEYPKPNLTAKYQKHIRILKAAGYPFPSVRMSALGWKSLVGLLENKRLRTVDYPEILKDGLLFPITDAEVSKFNLLRDKRNKIAHGRLSKYKARTAIDDGTWLRQLATRIDRHVVEDIMIIDL